MKCVGGRSPPNGAVARGCGDATSLPDVGLPSMTDQRRRRLSGRSVLLGRLGAV